MTLADYMAKHGLSDEQVARRCGCDRSTINRIRNGVMPPRLDIALAIQKMSKGRVPPSSFGKVA